MCEHTIMVVEDNPTTRKMFRVALEREGLRVLEAQDARTALEHMKRQAPDLVLQDFCLPDMAGIDLVRKLRGLPGGQDLPIIALSGFLEGMEEARSVSAGFTSFLVKPIEPSRLVDAIRLHLPVLSGADPNLGRARRVLLVDDEPMQLKLLSLQLTSYGFEVATASDASAALAHAANNPPDAIISDILMPGTDGFELCLRIRRDPALARVPVTLVSSHYFEDEDQSLARRVGANALVRRTPESKQVLDALVASLAVDAPRPIEPVELLIDEHRQRLIRQLQRQVRANGDLGRACALQGAQLAFFHRLATMSENRGENTVREALIACLDAAGLSRVALYLAGPDGAPVLQHAIGFNPANHERLADFFGLESLFQDIVSASNTCVIPSAQVPADIAAGILDGECSKSGLLVPLRSDGRCVGVMVLASRSDITDPDSVGFAENLAAKIGRAMALVAAHLEATAASHRYATLMEHAHDVIVVLTPEGTIREVNRRTEELLALPRNQIIGRDVRDFEAAGQVGEEMRQYKEEVERGSSRNRCVRLARADGAIVSVEFNSTPLTVGGERLVLSIGRDISEQLRVQSQLMLSDRMATVGTMAAGVAHEINNPLAALIANLEFVNQGLNSFGNDVRSRLQSAKPSAHDDLRIWLSGQLASVEEPLRDARASAERVRQVARDIKVFSRPDAEKKEAVDIRRVLESALRLAWNEIRHRARLVKDYGDVPPVEGNEARFGQVFLNLIVNAAQSIPEGSTEKNEIRVTTRLANDGRVMVEIRDTGCGIPKEIRTRIFDPFFTTKPVGIGTGLGLAICHRIVTLFGGELSFESQVGKGTVFRTLFPVAQVKTAEAEPTVVFPTATRRGRILVVDDEVMFGAALRRALTPDHEVVSLDAATPALERIAGGERFDVILCDLMMPHMGGMELHAELALVAADQAQRMIFMTGGAFTPRAREFLDHVPNPRLEKPFEVPNLQHLIASMVR
ncbi:MAG: response regulator [Deltaproteobacteria bacterium]|nr:response regulator [Deltaproteobacteria bacterium]